MSKVLIHENFTDSVNDIALIRLGMKAFLVIQHIHKQFTEDRVDLSIFSPACLPHEWGASFVDQEGHVYGEHYIGLHPLS